MSFRKICIIAIIGIAIIAIIFALFMLHHYERVPLTKNLCFGMSPVELQLVYGKPDQINYSDLSPSFTYSYHYKSEDNQVIMKASFIKGDLYYELYEIRFIYDIIETDKLLQCYNSIVDICQTEYSVESGYYEYIRERKTNLGIKKGAISLDGIIEVNGSTVDVVFSRVY